jgi:hypothetical protein
MKYTQNKLPQRIKNYSRALVAHTCNPSYLGGRDQEDQDSKPEANIPETVPPKKKASQKRAGGLTQGVGPRFKPQYRKKKIF